MSLSVVQVIGNSVIGGAEIHLLDLVQGLRDAGLAIEVICPRPGPLTDLLALHGIPVQMIEMVQPRPGDDYGLDWAAVQAITDYLRTKKPDVVHSHLYPAHLHASLAAHECGIGAIVQTAHTLIVRPGDVLLGRLTRAHTIAVARAAADLLENAGVPAAHMTVIYNGVSQEHVAVDPALPIQVHAALALGAGPVVGTVARLSPEKGIDVLLHAIQQVVQEGTPLTVLIAGTGPQEAELQRLAHTLGLDGTVHFLGVRRDIPVVNRLLDLFILPSREEACPMALIEAMVAGRAVIATDVGGSPEVVTHGIDGWLVPPNDPAAMAQAISSLLADAGRRAILGAAARQKILTHFTREQMIQATIALYERLLRA